MECLTEKEASEKYGPAKALTDHEIRNLIKFANLHKRDIFYDLGSGNASVLISISRKTKTGKIRGIESDVNRFCKSVKNVKKYLTKNQIERVEPICADYRYYDFTNATKVYTGICDFGSKVPSPGWANKRTNPVDFHESQTESIDREQAARTALQEIELDYQLGNIAESDYRSLRERYVRRALVALKSRYDREQELDEMIETKLQKMN